MASVTKPLALDDTLKRVANALENQNSEMGALAGLTTDAKTSLAAAINEVDNHADTNASAIGNLANLNTTTKSSLVEAINEIAWNGHEHGGSILTVKTTNPDLYGQEVTLSDGFTTRTGIISATGECTFGDILSQATVNVNAMDTNFVKYAASVSMPRFGTYTVNLTNQFSTINFSTSNENLYGASFELCKDNVSLFKIRLNNTGTGSVHVTSTGTYICKGTVNNKSICESISISSLYESYDQSIEECEVYAFYIDKSNSDPDTCVHEYLDCPYGSLNVGYTYLRTNQDSESEDYGKELPSSWSGHTAFFFPKPCMLGYDGEVKYYLDPDDFEKKADGTASDVGDYTYEGNAMMEFPAVYFKRYSSGNRDYCIIASKKIDSDFHAYAHHDVNGNVLDNIYIGIYHSCITGSSSAAYTLRSLSGKAWNSGSSVTAGAVKDVTLSNAKTYAAKNNISGYEGEGWYFEHFADTMLIQDLYLLVTLSTNSQTAIGQGSSYLNTNISATYLIPTGKINRGTSSNTSNLNDKGLFYGETENSSHAMKLFGLENWWGNYHKRIAGIRYQTKTWYIKMTHGTEDGSDTTGFDDTSGFDSKYVAVPIDTELEEGAAISGYVNKWSYSNYGLLPTAFDGDGETYLCDFATIGDPAGTSVFQIYGSGIPLSESDKIGIFRFHMVSSDSLSYSNPRLVYKGLAPVNP